MQPRNFLKRKQKNWENLQSEEFKTFKMVYSFQATLAARGYHVYKNTTWEQAKVGDRNRLKFLLKLRATKNQKKLICIAIPSEHQSTNKSKQLDRSLEKFADTSISSSRMNTVILMGLQNLLITDHPLSQLED